MVVMSRPNYLVTQFLLSFFVGWVGSSLRVM